VLPVRLAGRVIAIDSAGRVLLFRYDDPPPKGDHWSTPGGGVEGDEDFYAAACRELVEETGWTDVTVTPVEVHVDSNVQWSYYRQGLNVQHDHYFIGRVPEEARPLGDVAVMHESDGIRGHRWWTLAELDTTAEAIFPPGLAELVRAAIA
jgi:8-oxo-dGTP pyrophosphatase MutT (NUDIX family)